MTDAEKEILRQLRLQILQTPDEDTRTQAIANYVQFVSAVTHLDAHMKNYHPPMVATTCEPLNEA